jgi:Domain of unknown function (DUF4340)
MTPRRVLTLLIASVLIIVLAVWLSSNRPTSLPTAAGAAVLQGLDPSAVNSVSEIRVAKGDGTRTTLKKGTSDWRVAERDYPADSGKVRKLLLDLAALNVIEEKTSAPENYPALGVEDTTSEKATGTRVDAVTTRKTYSLIVGKSSGAKSGFVRVVGAPRSLLATPLISVDPDPRRWLDHTLLDIPQERIKEVAVQPAQGPQYTVTRASKEQADFTVAEVPQGRKLANPAAADPIAGSLAGVSLDDVQHTPASAPAGVAHAVFSTFDGLRIEVAGHKDGTKTQVSFTAAATAPATEAQAKALAARLAGWEFEIPSYKYDSLFRPLEDLLEKLPEPAAKGAKKPAAAQKPPGSASPGPGK